MFAANVLEFEAAGGALVHWLPHAAGMRRRRGDGQCHGGKSTHEHENKQPSGGQSVHHGFAVWRASRPKDRILGAGAQVFGGYVGGLRAAYYKGGWVRYRTLSGNEQRKRRRYGTPTL